jgi:hypothetical protein
MEGFTPLPALLGGALIGLAASLLLLFDGRVAGVSGIVGGLVTPRPGDVRWRASFVAGLVVGGLALRALYPAAMAVVLDVPFVAVALAGLLVGVGTRLGNGCTSGHGVCGISRGSKRSLAATCVFMAAGAVTVFVVRHLMPGTR